MQYSNKQRQKRIKYRTDLSGYVYHLTRSVKDDEGNKVHTSLDILLKIIQERTLLGSDVEKGFIVGKRKAICLQDTPISSLLQNINHEIEFSEELGNKERYSFDGIGFPKSYIYSKGGRPVIYEKKEIAKEMLPEKEWWRIVSYDLTEKEQLVDWTHEREWRIPMDKFQFELNQCIVILKGAKTYKIFIEKVDYNDLKSILGIVQCSPLIY